MEITAMALALMVLTLVAGCLLWALLFHFEEIYLTATAGISHPRTARLLFLTFAGTATVGTIAVLLLEFQELFTSRSL